MPLDPKASKTRSRLSDLQRKQICEYAEEHPNAKHQDIAEVLNDRNSGLKLERSTITKILKKYEVYKSIENEDAAKNRFRQRNVKFPTLELAMSVWVQQMTAADMPLSDQILKEKGMEFSRALNIDEKALLFSSG